MKGVRIPSEVSRVEGCDCGGWLWHAVDCTLNSLPEDQAQAALADAEVRVQAYVAEVKA